MDEAPRMRARESIALSLHDAEAAKDAGSRLFYPQSFAVLGRGTSVSMVVRAAQIGPIFLGELSYDRDVRIDCGELVTSYHVNLPLSGRLATRHRGVESVATPQRAAIYGPEGETVLTRWEARSRQLCLKIDRGALEKTMRDCLGRDIDGPIWLEPTLDLRSGSGRGWADLAILLNDQLRRPDSLVNQPVVAAPLVRGLLTGLLTAAGPRFRDLLEASTGTCHPPIVRRAVAYLEEHAEDAITTSDVAAHCYISVRALQEGFAKHLGRSPMHQLRTIRLQRAHEALAAADPDVENVTRIAHRWGFTNPGRFARAHQDRFGETPAQTLRRRG
jgi:AraC-like DNA-binding protein